jgi:hypothetical protein
VAGLAGEPPDSPALRALADRMAAELGWAPEAAGEQLGRWRAAQRGLAAELGRAEEGRRSRGLRAIWRCAACGRADLPHVVCWVAPFVLRYEPVPA